MRAQAAADRRGTVRAGPVTAVSETAGWLSSQCVDHRTSIRPHIVLAGSHLCEKRCGTSFRAVCKRGGTYLGLLVVRTCEATTVNRVEIDQHLTS